MSTYFVMTAVCLWWFVGLWGAAYWWTYEFGRGSLNQFPLWPFTGIMGPLTWAFGAWIHKYSAGPHYRNGERIR